MNTGDNVKPESKFSVIQVHPSKNDPVADVGFAMVPRAHVDPKYVDKILELAKKPSKIPKSMAMLMADAVFSSQKTSAQTVVSQSSTITYVHKESITNDHQGWIVTRSGDIDSINISRPLTLIWGVPFRWADDNWDSKFRQRRS